jgi:hypothetical protein
VVAVGGLIAAATLNRPNRVPNLKDSTGAVTLPNGWRITPAGKHVKLPGDLPMKIQVLDGSKFLILTAGFHDHSLNVVDARTQEVTATLDVVKSWDGMAFDPASGTVYLSGGGRPKRGFAELLTRFGITSPMKEFIDKPILRVRYADGKLTALPPLTIAGLDDKDRYISGLTLGPDARCMRSTFRRTPCIAWLVRT